MISFLKRYFARKRLRPVVGVLPRQLANGFGTREHYTYPQAKRAIATLRLPGGLERYALAAACTREELERSGVDFPADEYRRLRLELADLFGIDPGFTIKQLLATRSSPHEPAPDRTGGWFPGQAGGGHTGSSSD